MTAAITTIGTGRSVLAASPDVETEVGNGVAYLHVGGVSLEVWPIDGTDEEELTAVAELFEEIGKQAAAIGEELRRQARDLCGTCRGAGSIYPNGDEETCPSCGGAGVRGRLSG